MDFLSPYIEELKKERNKHLEIERERQRQFVEKRNSICYEDVKDKLVEYLESNYSCEIIGTTAHLSNRPLLREDMISCTL